MKNYILISLVTISIIAFAVTLISANSDDNKIPSAPKKQLNPEVKITKNNLHEARSENVKYPALSNFENELQNLSSEAQQYSVKISVMYNKVWKSSTKDGETEEYTEKIYHNLSGVIVRSEGYVLTLANPIEKAEKIIVTYGYHRYSAKVWAIDKISQLAILKIDAKNLPAAPFSNEKNINIGSLIVTCGNVYGLSFSVNIGTVCGVNRTVSLGRSRFYGVLQIDVSIFSGDAGGLCMNTKSEVIGIIWSNFKDRYNYSGNSRLNFVLPSNQVKKITDDLIKFKEVRRVKIGIMVSPVYNEEKRKVYMLIDKVMDNSPAALAGLLKSDVILSIDDTEIFSMEDIYKFLGTKNPDTTVKIKILRKSKESDPKIMTFDVILKE